LNGGLVAKRQMIITFWNKQESEHDYKIFCEIAAILAVYKKEHGKIYVQKAVVGRNIRQKNHRECQKRNSLPPFCFEIKNIEAC
jgi:hypothetical protein